MRKLTKTLCVYILMSVGIILITGCETSKVVHVYPPIYISRSDVLTQGTADQILAHNCKVDYQPKHCKPQGVKQ